MKGLLTEKFTDKTVSKKFLIVETNFRVYGHTTSEIEILILSFFLEMEIKLPGLVVGYMTRKSIRNALQRGLASQQIVDFLLNSSQHEVPPNVLKQIEIWENERERIKPYEAVMLEEFIDQKVYESSIKFAHSIGAYIWHDENNILVVHKHLAQEVIKYALYE